MFCRGQKLIKHKSQVCFNVSLLKAKSKFILVLSGRKYYSPFCLDQNDSLHVARKHVGIIKITNILKQLYLSRTLYFMTYSLPKYEEKNQERSCINAKCSVRRIKMLYSAVGNVKLGFKKYYDKNHHVHVLNIYKKIKYLGSRNSFRYFHSNTYKNI